MVNVAQHVVKMARFMAVWGLFHTYWDHIRSPRSGISRVLAKYRGGKRPLKESFFLSARGSAVDHPTTEETCGGGAGRRATLGGSDATAHVGDRWRWCIVLCYEILSFSRLFSNFRGDDDGRADNGTSGVDSALRGRGVGKTPRLSSGAPTPAAPGGTGKEGGGRWWSAAGLPRGVTAVHLQGAVVGGSATTVQVGGCPLQRPYPLPSRGEGCHRRTP